MSRLTKILFLIFALGVTVGRAAAEENWWDILQRADSLQKAAQYDSALVLAQKALAITEREYGTEDTSVARVVNRIGSIYWFQGNYPEAETTWKRALQIRERAPGADHLDVARSLNNLALLYQTQGRYDEAEPLFLRALQIGEKALGLEHPYVARTFLNNLALLYQNQGRYDEAEPLYLRALQILEKALGAEHPDITTSLNNLGYLYTAQGRYAEAERLYRRALQIREKALGPEHPDVASSLTNLGFLYYNQGRYAEAEPLYRRALQISERALGAEHPRIAQCLYNLANLYSDQGRYADAEPLYKHALDIQEKTLGSKHPVVASSLNDLACSYQDQGRYADAEPLLQRALQIREKALGPEHRLVAQTLQNLANQNRDQGRYAEADSLYRRALAICEKTLGPDHPDAAAALADFALNAMQGGQFAAAETAESRAWRIRSKNFHEGAAVLAERSAMEYSQFLTKESANYLSILLDSPKGQTRNATQIADVVVSSKSQVSEGILARNSSRVSESDSAAIKLADTLRYARFALSKLYVDGPGEDSVEVYKRKLGNATKEKERLEADLARRSASFRKDQELWEATAAKVAEHLPEHSVLVEYMRYEHRLTPRETEPRYLALVVKKHESPVVVALGKAAVIDLAMAWYRNHFDNFSQQNAANYDSISSELYRRIWQPIHSAVGTAATVFVAPDGELGLLSFAGLKQQDGRYLIEDHAIHYLATGRDLIRLESEPQARGHGLLALGNPDFDATSNQRQAQAPKAVVDTMAMARHVITRGLRSGCKALTEHSWSRLPATAQEVQTVGVLWQKQQHEGAEVLQGAAASEENFKRECRGKRVLHLATHGFFMDEDCRPKLTARGRETFVGENPMLHCGLALAGANQLPGASDSTSGEDGVVTAEEIAGLDLRGVDLVVLSACETGLGEVKAGEGVFGLRRAFQMAGARTVVSTLWRVEDQSAAETIQNLLTEGFPVTPESSRRAMLKRLVELRASHQSDHPFYWAGYVVTGDWK